MTRIRTYRAQKYFNISNSTAQDQNLSFTALGLLTYCLSMPEDWDFKPKLISKKRECGRDKTYALFNELIKNYRCIRIRKKSKNLWGAIEYEIFDEVEECKKRIKELEKESNCLVIHAGNLEEKPRRPKKTDDEKQTEYRRPDFQDSENKDIYKAKFATNDTNKANIEPVENVDKSQLPNEPHLSPPSHREGISLSADSSEVKELLELTPVFEEVFEHLLIDRWIKKFGVKMVLETLKLYFYRARTQKKRIGNPAAWMEQAFKGNYVQAFRNELKNKEFAIDLKNKYNLHKLIIKHSYCKVKGDNNKEYYYSIAPETFREILSTLAKDLI